MKTVCKKLLSLMLVAMLLVSAVPFQALAAEVDSTESTPATEAAVVPAAETESEATPAAEGTLAGQDTAEAWTTVRQIWNVELRTAYNKLTAVLGENSDVALADYATLESWMIAREAELMLLYPDNPELVAQTMVRIIIDQVNALCQLAQ